MPAMPARNWARPAIPFPPQQATVPVRFPQGSMLSRQDRLLYAGSRSCSWPMVPKARLPDRERVSLRRNMTMAALALHPKPVTLA